MEPSTLRDVQLHRLYDIRQYGLDRFWLSALRQHLDGPWSTRYLAKDLVDVSARL